MTDDHASETFFGYCISSYCFMMGVSSPLYGWWANARRTSRNPIATGCALMILGNIIYVLANVAPTYAGREWLVLVARLVMGTGAGIIGVIRSYVATASTARDRPRAISINTACWTAGAAVGPGLQAAFTPLAYPGHDLFGSVVRLNMYTAPALTGIVSLSIILLLLFTQFSEKYAGIVPEETRTDPFFVLPKFKWPPIVVCLYVWFTGSVIFTNIET